MARSHQYTAIGERAARLTPSWLTRWSIFLVIAYNPACAADLDAPIWSFGLGNVSCATWLSTPTNRIRGEQWVFGFWSGLNQASAFEGGDGAVGKSTDQPGIAGEVRKLCEEMPSKRLQDAAGTIFYRFKDSGR